MLYILSGILLHILSGVCYISHQEYVIYLICDDKLTTILRITIITLFKIILIEIAKF